MKLWQKDKDSLREVEKFTVGKDRELDAHLASFDVLGSLAHIRMLQSIQLLTLAECDQLTAALQAIYKRIEAGSFVIEDGVEDVHSQVELELTRTLGDVGKKIHSGRSRNDQVLVDLRLFMRHEMETVVREVRRLFDLLISLSEKHQADLLPGYTHLQLAMPSSFGLWFGAYAESLVDDVIQLESAYRTVNKNPLGSAAGYGSSFPLNRTMTTQLLGFGDLNYNVVYAQMGRGKTERIVAQGLASVGATLSRLSMDACLFMNQQFGFIRFPDELTTGSSIMPHKKNPDVWEIIRARGNQLQTLPGAIAQVMTNLPSGYHRDMQVLKEMIVPAFQTLRECLQMAQLMLSHIEVKKSILSDDQYQYLFSVEEVNKLVLAGVPFRDAYKQVGASIERGEFQPDKNLHHTHEGSIGNLCNDQISRQMNEVLARFPFESVHAALTTLLDERRK
jgi:argininosuccinate lyase